ncbi:MAG: ABC transporter permease [Chloroflexi bacterium]|nr:ABC transporter permease [Chloroflexota bacterium]
MKPADYDFIRDHAHLLKSIGMETWKSVTISVRGERMQSVDFQGITANIIAMKNLDVAQGRAISEMEVQRHSPVAFIGSDVAQHFFGDRDPIGKTIQADGVPYEVVGVAKSQGSVFGQSQDKFVLVPVYSYFKTYGTHNDDLALNAKAIDPQHVDEAEGEVRMLLRTFRHLKPGDDDTFTIFGSDTFAQAWHNLTGAISATALGIVSVFLVVGGIVIMNIMLAVVTERTHEIGIRKSLGARRRDILNQFLVESAVLAVTGGVMGVIIAFLLTFVVRAATPLPMAVPPIAIVLGVGLSLIVGLFFGIYPARQASKLDPIVALRAE